MLASQAPFAPYECSKQRASQNRTKPSRLSSIHNHLQQQEIRAFFYFISPSPTIGLAFAQTSTEMSRSIWQPWERWLLDCDGFFLFRTPARQRNSQNRKIISGIPFPVASR
jgi:hypothetical protein